MPPPPSPAPPAADDEDFDVADGSGASNMSLAYRLKWYLGTSRAGTVVDFTNFFFSAIYCINYVAET